MKKKAKKEPVKFRKRMPRNMINSFWPGKLQISIRNAVVWYKGEFGVRPMYVVALSKDVDEIQKEVRMWHEDVGGVVRHDLA